MLGTSRVVAASAILFACACGTGDTKLDPGDLELRDLLGVAPEVASGWDAEQRAAARRVFVASLDDTSSPIRIDVVAGPTLDERVTRTLATLDGQRFAAGDGALGIVRVELATNELIAAPRVAPTVVAAAAGVAAPVVELELSDGWGQLSGRGLDVLSAIAVDAGHTTGPLVVSPGPRLAVVASYVADLPGRLVVNPVLLAAIDPSIVDVSINTQKQIALANDDLSRHRAEPTRATANGNPYSFYGSVAECAYAQRTRCESCLSSSTCEAVTNTDGNTECTKLAENGGRGYFLLCINLSLAITAVNSCSADAVSGCARDGDAASDFAQLESNANFLDDMACASGLDGCLAKIYGAPPNPFPGLVDGGMPPTDPPREIDVSCNDSCDSDKSSNCEASPNCDCSGPSCGNSLSCDSTCSSSNDQSGCGDNCDSCSSDSGGGGGGGGGCSGDSGGSSGGGSCGSCSDSGGSSGGGDCGGGDCGGGDCGGGGGCGGGDCGGGGGCQVAKKRPNAGFAVALSLTWALLPVPIAALVRRRARRRKAAAADAASDATAKETP